MTGIIFLSVAKDSGKDIFDFLPDPPERPRCPICDDTGIRTYEADPDPEHGMEPLREEPCSCETGQLIADEWAPDYSGYEGGYA